MRSFGVWLDSLPFFGRWAFVGAAATGVAGGVAGLVLGLIAYAPTAPFAVIEVGLPAAVAGGVAGLAAGVIVAAFGRIRQGRARVL